MGDLSDQQGRGKPFSASSPANFGTEIFYKPESMAVSRAVMEAIPAMVAVLDNQLNYIYANQIYVNMVNSPQPSWEGLKLFEYLPAYLHEKIKPRVERATKGEAISYYLDFVPKDGNTRTILVNYHSLLPDDHGGLFVMTGLDATELKFAEQRLAEAQKFETIGQLTGGIAHDFNNNIAAILGIFSLLRNVVTDEKMLGWIDKGIGAADQCSKLTSQLLTFARRQTIQPRALGVNDHLRSVIELLRISIPLDISLSFADGAADVAVYADATQLESAVINLIFNARDALPRGGHVRIETSLARYRDGVWSKVAGTDLGTADEAPDFVMVEVADDGIGMTQEVAKLAFEPFFTTKERGQGSGMGLAMVDGFARQSGGSVELNTAPGRGTSIRLYLPRAERADHYAREAVIKQPSACAKLSVLVVEDDDDVAFVFREMLQSMGHSVRECNNALDALAILETTDDIDIVLADIMIRGKVTGLDLRERLLERYPNVRVICTSGYQDPNSGRSSVFNSEIEFLPKPFTYCDLATRLATGVSKKCATTD